MGFRLGRKGRSSPGGFLPLNLRFKVAICVQGEVLRAPPHHHSLFTKGAIDLSPLIEADCGEYRARLHFLFFYVCSANQDQFYYISFIRGNHLGLHYNKHIGFPLPPQGHQGASWILSLDNPVSASWKFCKPVLRAKSVLLAFQCSLPSFMPLEAFACSYSQTFSLFMGLLSAVRKPYLVIAAIIYWVFNWCQEF